MGLWSEAHSYEGNGWAIHNSLDGGDLEVSPILKFQEFLSGGENTSPSRFPRSNQLACGTLNRYLLIPRRLIFESRVRVGSPRLAAAPVGPEMRPWLSASAASIIPFSCLSSAPLSATLGRLKV